MAKARRGKGRPKRLATRSQLVSGQHESGDESVASTPTHNEKIEPAIPAPTQASSTVGPELCTGVLELQIGGKTYRLDITEINFVAEQAAADIGLDVAKLTSATGDRWAEFGRELCRAFIAARLLPDDPAVATMTVCIEIFARARTAAEKLKKNMLIWQT